MTILSDACLSYHRMWESNHETSPAINWGKSEQRKSPNQSV